MPKATRAKHRTLWISDVHLGSPGCKAKLLTEFLKRNDCEQLYLVGDIFDGWKMKSRFYWTPEHSRVIKEVISKARKGTKVYYLTGNHDGFMRQFVKNQLRLGKIRVANEVVHTTADGRRLLVMHGDAFDDVVNGMPVLAYAGDVAYEGLIWGSEQVNKIGARFGMPYFSFSALAKDTVKGVVQYLSGVDNKVLHRCRREKLSGVVTGHTHHAEIRMLQPGITSLNCGDWVESCTALTEDFEGNIEIVSGMPVQRLEAERVVPEKNQPWLAQRLLERLPQVARVAKRGTSRRRAPKREKAAEPSVAPVQT